MKRLRGKELKYLFIAYFDGSYEVDAMPNVPTTMEMGVCKLDYRETTNTLTVYLRRPGLLIGKAGEVINAVEEYLSISVEIKEVNLLTD